MSGFFHVGRTLRVLYITNIPTPKISKPISVSSGAMAPSLRRADGRNSVPALSPYKRSRHAAYSQILLRTMFHLIIKSRNMINDQHEHPQTRSANGRLLVRVQSGEPPSFAP